MCAARLREASALGAVFGIESFRMIVAIVEFIGALAISLRMNVRLTVAMLCLLPIYWLLVRGVSGGYRRSLHEVAETGGRLSGKLHETLDGISEVKNLGAEEQRAGDVICASEELARATMRQGRIAVWAGQGLSVIGNLASALAVYVAGRSIVAGDFAFGGYTAFVAYMGRLFAPIGRMSGFGFAVQPSLTALERMSEFLGESTEDERYPRLPAPACMAEVEFEDVVFSYPGDPGRPALNGVSLVLESPGSVAVVGPNGSGKSTLIKLLLGYYTDYSGRIRIDGQDLRELNVLEIRRRIGVVAQDPFLFDGTVADNLELAANGRMGGFAERTGSIDQAVRQDRVLERLLSRLPQGLATKMGEGGRNLSGGQRQTVAIARAFLRSARIVVFDEATAHLDSEAHAVVEEAVQELFSDRLCIVLTHDPGLARIARQRVRMNQGRVVDID